MPWAVAIFREFGGLYLFNIQIKHAWKRSFRINLKLTIDHLTTTALRSLSTVCFAGFFVGAILVIQFYLMLSKYNAESMLGGLNTSATIREVGPLIISFLLAGKIGAYTAAELGTMRVTEQIDAIRCLGTDPIEYLIVPRFLSIVICSVLLLILGLMVGIVGSILVAQYCYHINYMQYLESVPRFLTGWTVFGGLFKSFTYGWIVASVATYKGYYASGGAKGVGVAVTESAMYTNLFIVFANAFTSYLLESFESFYYSAFRGFS